MFFFAYTFKGHVHAFAGRVKVVSHLSCRTSAILKYFCPLVTCISESFYDSLDPKPELLDTKDFGLSIVSEADISTPSFEGIALSIPVLVVLNTEYNRTVPVIIGTNVIRLLKQSSVDSFIPEEWQTAFSSLVDHTLPVKTTNNFSIRLGPGEVKTVHGLVRNTADLENAVTKQTDTLLSGNITIFFEIFKQCS